MLTTQSSSKRRVSVPVSPHWGCRCRPSQPPCFLSPGTSEQPPGGRQWCRPGRCPTHTPHCRSKTQSTHRNMVLQFTANRGSPCFNLWLLRFLLLCCVKWLTGLKRPRWTVVPVLHWGPVRCWRRRRHWAQTGWPSLCVWSEELQLHTASSSLQLSQMTPCNLKTHKSSHQSTTFSQRLQTHKGYSCII